MEACCVIQRPFPLPYKGFQIFDYNTFKKSGDKSTIHFIGTYKECLNFIARSTAAQELVASANREHEEYFIIDSTWPSRRWNDDMTDYIDLSGEPEKTFTREEVYLVAQRSVHAVINNLLTDNRTRTIKEVINSEIETVKLF